MLYDCNLKDEITKMHILFEIGLLIFDCINVVIDMDFATNLSLVQLICLI